MLLHEIVHQRRAHFGKRTRAGYHNRERSEKMESVGLMPSDTGALGGHRVGQQMTQYIIEGGSFERCPSRWSRRRHDSRVDVTAKKVPMSIAALLGPTGEPASGPDGGDDRAST